MPVQPAIRLHVERDARVLHVRDAVAGVVAAQQREGPTVRPGQDVGQDAGQQCRQAIGVEPAVLDDLPALLGGVRLAAQDQLDHRRLLDHVRP